MAKDKEIDTGINNIFIDSEEFRRIYGVLPGEQDEILDEGRGINLTSQHVNYNGNQARLDINGKKDFYPTKKGLSYDDVALKYYMKTQKAEYDNNIFKTRKKTVDKLSPKQLKIYEDGKKVADKRGGQNLRNFEEEQRLLKKDYSDKSSKNVKEVPYEDLIKSIKSSVEGGEKGRIVGDISFTSSGFRPGANIQIKANYSFLNKSAYNDLSCDYEEINGSSRGLDNSLEGVVLESFEEGVNPFKVVKHRKKFVVYDPLKNPLLKESLDSGEVDL